MRVLPPVSTMAKSTKPIDTPVKNTFIHFDEAAELPAKRARASSAPPEVRSEENDSKCSARPEQNKREDAGKSTTTKSDKEAKELKKPTVSWADVEDDPEDDNRSAASLCGDRKHSRSRSRSARRENKGDAPKELSKEERHEKRAGFVAGVKASEAYKAYLKDREANKEKAVKAPRTPDANEDCSKRSWEGKALQWRQSIREWSPGRSRE